MGTILSFRPNGEGRERSTTVSPTDCTIVIFPGVRIERQAIDLDLSQRVRDAAGLDEFDGLGTPRPRKSS
jgi:hypothetical protein